MRKVLIIFSAVGIIYSCKKDNSNIVKYPLTKKVDTVDTYFDDKVPDPYRWLEDDRSDETAQWVKEQNKATFGYLEEIPFRKQLKKRLEQLWDYEKISIPFKEGNYVYYRKNNGLQDQYVIYRKKAGTEEEELFLDPNTFSEDGTTSLDQLSFSKSGNYVAYSVSEGGSDWRKVIVLDAINKEIIEDTLVDIKFAELSWKGDEGFFYSSYDKPEGSELSAKTDTHKLYYHKIRTNQKNDKLIFGESEGQKHRYVWGNVTEDDRYLIITASESTSGNRMYAIDLHNPENNLITIVDNFDNDNYVIENKETKLYIVTNFKAPNKRIVTVDISDPAQENWKDFIPETENVLLPSTGAGYFFAEYMTDAISNVFQYDYQGNLIREIELPGLGSIQGLSGKKDDENLYYYFTNYSTPASSYSFNPDMGSSELYWTPDINFNTDEYESKQVFYYSKDSTRVPMIITYKKGTDLNGKNPTILYGYGGFNVSLTPFFSIVTAVWLEQGGIYAVPNLRGGGEYGKKWHIAGTKMQKQNVFDDFIAAAEYLIENKYTSAEYLAIEGGSNGGLLVGATMTQRPDLIKVALPAVGVLDMLRYHKFTAGAGWAYDYGTSEESEEMFNYLKAYSPLHNVKEGINYPATLITTGDHDDRVVPAHSFKFAAELQEKQSGSNPVLIRINTKAGHGAGKPTSIIIDEYTDILSFTLFNMGYKELPNKSVLEKIQE